MLSLKIQEASVSLTEAELILLNNALNEVLHGIDVQEFRTRLGATEQEAQALLKQISDLLDTME